MDFAQEATEKVIQELTSRRRSFTGEDVYHRMHNKFVRRSDDLSACANLPTSISKYARMLFNQGYAVFDGYGSTIVPNGPVLYFPLPFYAKKKAQKIKAALGGN